MSDSPILSVSGLRAAAVEGNGGEILHGVDMDMRVGEVHAIMGPNGSGKSTLANVLAGHYAYRATGGSARLNGRDLLAMTPDERACEGLFLGFQHPVEIPGVLTEDFLRSAMNHRRQYRGLDPLDEDTFQELVASKVKQLEIAMSLQGRSINEGFSGGEKKRIEILQMLVFDPTVVILDEIDSGLDIDALRIVSSAINSFRGEGKTILLVTHFARLLEYVKPDKVHVIVDGVIRQSGGMELVSRLETEGYGWLDEP